jgi:hypothetical protein
LKKKKSEHMKIRAAVSPVIKSVDQLKTGVVYFATAVAVVMGVMANAPVASAQNASQATIPFAFSANHQAFPPGHYRVVRETDNYLTLMSTETGIAAGLMVRTTRTLEPAGKNSLVFLHDQRGYHLLTVRFAQGGVQSELSLQPRPERDLAKTVTGASTEVGMN